MKITTNNQPRDIISWHDLTEKEKQELEWAGETADFFRYKGWTYCCEEFMRIPDGSFPNEWQGYFSDSFFSGILIKYADHGESVIVGRYYA